MNPAGWPCFVQFVNSDLQGVLHVGALPEPAVPRQAAGGLCSPAGHSGRGVITGCRWLRFINHPRRGVFLGQRTTSLLPRAQAAPWLTAPTARLRHRTP